MYSWRTIRPSARCSAFGLSREAFVAVTPASGAASGTGPAVLSAEAI